MALVHVLGRKDKLADEGCQAYRVKRAPFRLHKTISLVDKFMVEGSKALTVSGRLIIAIRIRAERTPSPR